MMSQGGNFETFGQQYLKNEKHAQSGEWGARMAIHSGEDFKAIS